jgi:hypothetical protein
MEHFWSSGEMPQICCDKLYQAARISLTESKFFRRGDFQVTLSADLVILHVRLSNLASTKHYQGWRQLKHRETARVGNFGDAAKGKVGPLGEALEKLWRSATATSLPQSSLSRVCKHTHLMGPQASKSTEINHVIAIHIWFSCSVMVPTCQALWMNSIRTTCGGPRATYTRR